MLARPLVKAALLGALLLISGCAAPTNDGSGLTADGSANHPISVEPSYRSLKVDYAPGASDMAVADAAKFDDFVAAYRDHGNGSIEISVPNGPGSRAAIGFFVERMAHAGVPRDKILLSTHDAPSGDYRIEINYITYEAHTAPCGDWSEDLAFTEDNATAKNFGCAVQHNIAAMVADPRDLIGPRPMEPADTARGQTIISDYEQGKPTAADKTSAQSGSISDVQDK